MKLERFAEAKQDCDAALKLEPTNKKAFYRRALANKGLQVRLALWALRAGKPLNFASILCQWRCNESHMRDMKNPAVDLDSH